MKSDETSYLLKNPENALRLLKGIEDYENGLGKEKNLIDIDCSDTEKVDFLTKEYSPKTKRINPIFRVYVAFTRFQANSRS